MAVATIFLSDYAVCVRLCMCACTHVWSVRNECAVRKEKIQLGRSGTSRFRCVHGSVFSL